jgi:DNA polymerase I-like protein with 3'-5' exonuclease and polymerase domains
MTLQPEKNVILPTMNTVFLDIEADGLNPTKIHCVVTKRSNEAHLTHLSRRSLIDELAKGGKVCGHNLIGYDLPVMRKLWGISVPSERVLDTLVLSRLFHPDREGGHSLAVWGMHLGFPKGDHSEWDVLSDEMIEYCKRDVDVTEKLHNALMVQMQMREFSQQCVDLEHSIAFICKDQEDNGFEFDRDGAVKLYEELTTRMHRIENDLQQVFPPIIEERISEKTGKKLTDKVTVFNVGSRQQIAERLKSKGAVWKELTPSGKPKVDEKTLKEQIQIPEAKIILRYLMCQKRASQVDSWIKAVTEKGRIHGRVRPIGAVTGRMAHSSPNMAQVPAVRAEYGKQCRELFTVPKDRVLVGADASGLELRMLAHYMDDADYTHEILTGDIHTANQKAAGLATRDQAKTFIYAFLYGAGDAKIGSVVGSTSVAGRALKKTFLENTPALAELREKVAKDCESGFLDGLDGRKIRVRSAHAALNTLLQGAGAIVMKQAIIILYDLLARVDFKLVAQVHDEWQIECRPEDADFIGKSCVNSMVFAGEVLQLNCPLDGEYRVGNSWADTH